MDAANGRPTLDELQKIEGVVPAKATLIVAHNHPSGGISPSKEDVEITKQLKAAGETLGIKLLDHIIFNQKDYYSFLEKGHL